MKPRRGLVPEIASLAGLAGLAIYFLWVSWRKWPDPLVDFGRELYIPWRLSQGALLYRDVDDFYGPLSQYVNAGFFRVFGPGLMVLVTANLAVFAGIVATLYVILKRAWGWVAALGGSACFIAVFGFSQFVSGNFTYAAPYAHESTHGVLICLLLVLVLIRWVNTPTRINTALSGFLFGLSAVLKPEIMLAAFAVTLGAAAIRFRMRRGMPPGTACYWLIACALPTAIFTFYFWVRVPFASALSMACRAWMTVVSSSRFTGEFVQSGFLGLDSPVPHLLTHLIATGCALLLVAGIGTAAFFSERLEASGTRWAFAIVALGIVGWLSWQEINWMNSGRALLGFALAYMLVCAVSIARRPVGSGEQGELSARLLFAILAAALMARMLLNGRVYQFGFYQAAFAGVLVPAVLLGEVGKRSGGKWAQGMVIACAAFLLIPGLFVIAANSGRILRLKTFPVGEGRDRFYAVGPQLDPTGQIVELLRTRLTQTQQSDEVLVLPEGEMINYLARRRSPLPPFFYFSAALAGEREGELVTALERHPPNWVVIVSRDLREYGIARYGEAPGKGQLLMRWVDQHYQLTGRAGGDPLDVNERGAVLLRRR